MNEIKVLIIEDDEWLAEQFSRVLKNEKYITKTAAHALSAIELIDSFKPDVLILDVLLTGSTAFTLMHELQTYHDTSKIPIIICSNLASELDLNNLQPYGVRRILDKALMKPADLLAAVKSVLL